MLDHSPHLGVANQEHTKCARGEPRLGENLFDRERAARDVGGVLQHAGVAGHERGRGKPVHLPKREVPRHHREDDAERLERDVRPGGLGLDHIRCEIRLGVLGVVVANPGTLLRFGDTLLEWLAHLQGHELRQLVLALSEDGAGFPEGLRARGE